MLVTQHPVLRRFWYPVMPLADLAAGPQSFTLLNQPLVLWPTASGEPAALADRCCHGFPPSLLNLASSALAATTSSTLSFISQQL